MDTAGTAAREPLGGETVLESRAVEITFFEDRAEVRRVARVPVGQGAGESQRALVSGLSPFVDARSLVVRPAGAAAESASRGARIVSSRVVWAIASEPVLGREAAGELEQEARLLDARLSALDLEIDRAHRAECHAHALAAQICEGLGSAPQRLREAEILAGWRGALHAARAEWQRAGEERLRLYQEREREGRLLEKTRARLSEGRTLRPRVSARAEVELHRPRGSGREAPLEIELVYRVPLALWRPEHSARLLAPATSERAEGEAKVELVTFAVAWQRTGEDWSDVSLAFSTARPARAASPPLLDDDVLFSRRKTDAERQRVIVEAREQAIALSEVEGAARKVDEMPGVDDGGEPRAYRAEGRASIPSDGQPVRVEIERRLLEGRVDRVAFPERAPSAHHRFRGALSGGGPLLAGPLRLARGASVVGRARTRFYGEGAGLELGFGADDAVRIRRDVTEERTTTPVVGTQRRRRKVTLHLSNLSGEPRRLVVVERVPVSEIEAVEISLEDARGWRPSGSGEDGLLEREIELPAAGHEELSLTYEIRAGSKVVLPG